MRGMALDSLDLIVEPAVLPEEEVGSHPRIEAYLETTLDAADRDLPAPAGRR